MRPRLVVLLTGLLAISSQALALTDEEVFRDFRFNLINPGARSLALGGAFVSLADDATAAQANPAGLGFLNQSEYFAELRVVDNAAQSSISEETLPAGIESFVATGTDLDDVVSPSFISAVTTYRGPGKAKRRWTVGISRQELINIRNTTVSSFAFTFPQSAGAVLAEGDGSIDVEATNVNVSVGVRVTDHFGVGGTLTYSRLSVTSQVVNQIVDTGGNLADEPILERTIDLRTSIDDSDDDVVFSLGMIYKRLDRPRHGWSVGAVFRRAPRFSVIQSIDPGLDGDSDGMLDEGLDLFGVRDRLGSQFLNRFNLPDVFGAGASWRPRDPFTLSLDVERILYSNLLDGYIAGVNVLTGEDAEFTIDDATDFRIGAEYLLLNTNNWLPKIALRAGAFTEEPSSIRARSTGSESFATEEVFGGRGRQLHGAAGLGLIFDRYKVDFGIDVSETDNEYLISFIYRGKGN